MHLTRGRQNLSKLKKNEGENNDVTEDQNGVDMDYEISQHEINEQLVDTDSEKES